MLKFESTWRLVPPPDGCYKNTCMTPESVDDFYQLITKIAVGDDRWSILESFKTAFAKACGFSDMQSSTESWAETDLQRRMSHAAENAPLFIDAFYEVCEQLRTQQVFTLDVEVINRILIKYDIGYIIRPPMLLLRESIMMTPVAVTESSPTIAEAEMDMLNKSLQHSDELLTQGHGCAAVQESLWVLESISTSLRGIESDGKVVQGKYFNDIVDELHKIARGSTLDQVLKWVRTLYGYLSSPTGGGIRHGLDVTNSAPISQAEARLYCNLIRSYITYILAEHRRLIEHK